jgi:hypothetical protein
MSSACVLETEVIEHLQVLDSGDQLIPAGHDDVRLAARVGVDHALRIGPLAVHLAAAMATRPWWLLPPGRINPLWWIALGAGMLVIDHFGGPAAQYPVMYAVPVVLAAWYSGEWPALALAISVPLLRLVFLVAQTAAPIDVRLLLLTLFRGVIIAFLGIWFTRLADLERALERRVKVLEGMLAICAFCKKIRNEAGDWEQLEGFISRKSEAEFSHGVCPACSETHYPGMMDESA